MKKVPEKANSRRRPSPVISSYEETDSLPDIQKEIIQEQESILKELAKKVNMNKQDIESVQLDASEPNYKNELNRPDANQLKADTTSTPTSSTTPKAITTITTTTATTTASTTTFRTTTEPQQVRTEKLIANAGEDLFIYYPSRVCILNGTKTELILKSADDDEYIRAWHWTKLDSSPAFGVIIKI
jgi:hypothetical protein